MGFLVQQQNSTKAFSAGRELNFFYSFNLDDLFSVIFWTSE